MESIATRNDLSTAPERKLPLRIGAHEEVCPVPKIHHHPEHDEQLGLRIATFRKARSITQIDLAQRVGITQGGLSKYECGQLRIHSELLRQLADALAVSTDELLGVPAKAARAPKVSAADREAQRLWKKFQLVMELPEKDRRAVIRLVNSLVGAGQSRQRKAPVVVIARSRA